MTTNKGIKEMHDKLDIFNDMYKEIIPYLEEIEKISNRYGERNICFRIYGDGKYLDFTCDEDMKLERYENEGYKIESKFKVV